MANTLCPRFLISALQITYVLDQPSAKLMRQSLDELPDDPDENFNRTIQRVQMQLSPRRKLAMAALMWLTHMRVSLGKDELCQAVAINNVSNIPTIGPPPDPDKIVESCLGLVTVSSEDGSFRLVHLSVQEYLHQNTDRLFAAGDAQLGRLCLAYLQATVDANPSIKVDDGALEAVFNDLSLLRYVTDFWGVHASARFTAEVEADTRDFLGTPSLVLVWSKLSQATKSYTRVKAAESFPSGELESLFSWMSEEDDIWPGYAGGEPSDGNDAANTPRPEPVYQWVWKLAEPPRSALSILHIAAQFDLVKILQEELSSGKVDVNCTDDADSTPLMVACHSGSSCAMNLILAREDLRLNKTNKNGDTAFCIAVAAGETGIVKRLLDDHRLDVNLGCPLLAAVERNNRNMAQMLLRIPELNVNACKDETSKSALWLAVSEILYDMVMLILQRQDLDPSLGAPESDQNPFIHYASEFVADLDIQLDSEICDCALIMLALGKHPKVAPWTSETGPISFAWIMYTNGTVGSRKIFKDKGLARFCDGNNRTLLHEAVDSEDEEAIRHLLEDGADPAAKTKDGVTPLHEAAKTKGSLATQILLDAGVDIDVEDEDSWTPLHYAVWRDREENVQLLLSRGAGVSRHTKKGYSTLQMACNYCLGPEVPRLLLDNGADPDEAGPTGMRPLHFAALKGRKEICKLLLQPQYHVDVNAFAPGLGTPLSLATWDMNGCIGPLLEHGADATVLDVYGRTPLDWAARYVPVFKQFGSLCRRYSPTPEETTRRVLEDSVRLELRSLVGKSSTGSLTCCRMLYMLGDRNSARDLSRGLVESVKDGAVYELDFECAVCRSSSGPHFVCETCPRVNFCSECLESAERRTTIPWCRGHGSWRVPDEGWSDVKVLTEEEKDDVLSKVAAKYLGDSR